MQMRWLAKDGFIPILSGFSSSVRAFQLPRIKAFNQI